MWVTDSLVIGPLSRSRLAGTARQCPAMLTPLAVSAWLLLLPGMNAAAPASIVALTAASSSAASPSAVTATPAAATPIAARAPFLPTWCPQPEAQVRF